MKDFAHEASTSGEGDCQHHQPMWGFCRECRRYDIAPVGVVDGQWGRNHLPPFEGGKQQKPNYLPDNAVVSGAEGIQSTES